MLNLPKCRSYFAATDKSTEVKMLMLTIQKGGTTMAPLALNIETSAEILNVAPDGLRQAIDEKEITATRIGDELRISIFVLSELLSVTPDELLEYLEDFYLAEKIEEVDSDEGYSPEEGRRIYEQYLNEGK